MRLCKICKVKFEPKYNNVWWCSVEHGLAYAKLKQSKPKRGIEDLHSQINKHYKNKDSYKKRLNKARAIFQKWVRLRDKDLPCISCGCISKQKYDGGHYLKAEVYPNIIFNEHNVNKQCSHCNRTLSGNEASYAIGLIKKIGLENYNNLLNQASKHIYKYSDEQLENIKQKYKCHQYPNQNG